MAGVAGSDIASLVSRNERTILPEWVELQKKAGILNTGRISPWRGWECRNQKPSTCGEDKHSGAIFPKTVTRQCYQTTLWSASSLGWLSWALSVSS
jgi:hypothetical protein